MSGRRRFRATVTINQQYLRLGTDPLEDVRQRLTEQLTGALRGPRGGSYIGEGPTSWAGPEQIGDDWAMNRITFAAWGLARYVRPVPKK